jgi:hypothetical protein
VEGWLILLGVLLPLAPVLQALDDRLTRATARWERPTTDHAARPES